MSGILRPPNAIAKLHAEASWTPVQVLESVDVVEPALVDGRAGFGTRVVVEDPDGRTIAYDLVARTKRISPQGGSAPRRRVAQALLGKRAGDVAVLRRPKGGVEVTVVSVTLPDRG